MIRCLKPLAIVSAALSLSACTVLPESVPPRVVSLAGEADPPVFEQTRPESLRVDLPLASGPFDGTSVLIQPRPWEFRALPDTRWRDSLPMVVHDQLVQTLRDSNGFSQVLAANSAANADIALLSEVRGFHARRTGQDTDVVIHLHHELLHNRSRETLCVLDEKQVVPAQDSSLDSLMAAFSEGAHEAAAETARWAFNCLEKTNRD